MKSRRMNVIFIALLACCLHACATVEQEQQPLKDVPEIRPGILQGYLPMDKPFQSVEFVPASPEENSAQQQLDTAVSNYALTLWGSPRWEMAKHDAHLGFPAAANTFSCALGVEISEQQTPELYMLLRRTLADVGLATYSAKNAYQRKRPFMVNGQPTCTPDEEDALRKDGSYPSGHTSIGWGWALILAELSPHQAEAILARGRAFGESRLVCNVHWYSDVVAGRMVGAGAVAALHTNQQFLDAMAAARAELDRVRADGLAPDMACATQGTNLSFGL